MPFRIFVFLGFIHLLMMLRTDMKRMKVDSRHNWFMMGVISFVFLSNYPGLLIVVGLTVIALTFGIVLKKYTGFGDVEMGTWAIIGFGVLNLSYTVIYLIWFVVLKTLYMIPMRRAKVTRLPGTPLFLGTFIITAACAYFLELVMAAAV